MLQTAVEQREGETMLRLSAALGRFWFIHGHITEGRRWMDAALAQDGKLLPSVRAKLLHAAGILALTQGEYVVATTLEEQSLAL